MIARLLPTVLFGALLCRADGLSVVRAGISDSDGGAPNAADSHYQPGDSLYFTARIAGYAKDSNSVVHLSYRVEFEDANGVALAEPFKKNITAEITPQDTEWLPKIESSLNLPSELFTGEYKIVVKVDDSVAKTSAEAAVTFHVRGRDDIRRGDALAVEAFHFLRHEDDAKPAERAVYVPGDHLWAKFDITGFKYGPGNQIDVTYQTSVLGPDGKTLWTQKEPVGANGESFYPRAFVPAEMGIELQAKIKPGSYTLVVLAKDAIGNQSCEIRQAFTIEGQ
jgi:hypothetical protein